MATFPLVNVQDDLGPLLKLSLLNHKVPVTAVFELIEEATGERFIAVATPLVDQKGSREAYLKIFTALADESFTTPYLRIHILVLATEELQAIRRALKSSGNEAHLPRLAQFSEVSVRSIDAPDAILKTGFLHVSHLDDKGYRVTFAPSGHSYTKVRDLSSLEQVRKLLRTLRTANSVDLDELTTLDSLSFIVSERLDMLYEQGLV